MKGRWTMCWDAHEAVRKIAGVFTHLQCTPIIPIYVHGIHFWGEAVRGRLADLSVIE